MKKLLLSLVIISLFVSGCWSAPLAPVLWIAPAAVAALSISSNVDPSVEENGGAWYVDPNESE